MASQPNIATITINNQTYSFWESVICERTYGEPVSYATLQCAEIGPTDGAIANLKIGIGDEGKVYLAGQLAATGVIDMRQVAYNGTTHGVQVRLHSYIQDLLASTVDGKPGQYTNSVFQQISQAVAKPVNITINVNGNPSGADKIFERVSENIGETRIDFIKRLAAMRDLHMVDDSSGKTLNFGRGGTGGGNFSLIEGQNILAARCVMEYSWAVSQLSSPTQNFGNDNHFAQDAQDVTATANNPNYTGPRTYVAPTPMHGDKQDAQMYANHQMDLNALYMVEAVITVPGWTAPDGALWINKLTEMLQINLNSPMVYPTNAKSPPTLYLKGVKSMQDTNTGSTSELTLCLLSALGGTGTNLGNLPGAPT